ncbi:MAG TPA: peptidase M16 [Porphyromonadaceae bacterium]|nr:peptidase M16 [Porphyromonadaceae bacterium]
MKRFLFFIHCFVWVVVAVVAQSYQEKFPIDKNVRYGKLQNGLTYYIRNNPLPENRAGFYIVQRVGSMQEEDTQLGLAHFLEHMAFNGSENFPGRKKVVSFVEQNGGQFGTNINAYTSYDETVYSLSDIILSNDAIIDSCLLILHDWSGFLTLDHAEIDKERAIIKEEWRTRNDPVFRMTTQLYNAFFKGSRYANRIPIGDMQIVENFSYQELKEYYKKWYRPDLQGLIIVGDFDAERVEKKLKGLFSAIPVPVNAGNRIFYTVPDNEKPQIEIVTDPEATSTSISIFYKQDVIPDSIKWTEQGTIIRFLRILASQALSIRLSEISQRSDSPFSKASASIGKFMIAKTKDAWWLEATPKEGKIQESLTFLLRENKRAYLYGFTNTEIERIKASILASYRNLYNNRNKQKSIAYINEYMDSFLNGSPIPGIEFEYELVKRVLAKIGMNEVNEYMRRIVSDKNRGVAITGPQKEGQSYPTEEAVLKLIDKVKEEDLQKEHIEEPIVQSLLTSLPRKGKIVKATTDKKWNTTNWTLSNGIRVILKKTDLKDDQIILSAVSPGGSILFPNSDVLNTDMINSVVGLGGLASFSKSDLGKILAGKMASSSVSVSLTTQEIQGYSSIKDLETLFQIVYLQLTAPRKDKEAYSNFVNQLKEQLKNREQNPSSAFNDTIIYTLYGENAGLHNIQAEDVDKLNYDRIMEMYRTCFSNLGALTFTFVGTIDEGTMKPLVEQYLASLPKGKPLKSKNDESAYQIKKGTYVKKVYSKMDVPKASVFQLYSGKINRNMKNDLMLNLFKQTLDIMFIQNIRENEGGTYGISTDIRCRRFPEGLTTLQIVFDTDTAKLERIKPILHACVEKIANEGIDSETLNMLVDYTQKEFEAMQGNNAYWNSVLSTYYLYNEDIFSDYIISLKSITPDDIKNLANNLLKQENFIEVVMLPKKDG